MTKVTLTILIIFYSIWVHGQENNLKVELKKSIIGDTIYYSIVDSSLTEYYNLFGIKGTINMNFYLKNDSLIKQKVKFPVVDGTYATDDVYVLKNVIFNVIENGNNSSIFIYGEHLNYGKIIYCLNGRYEKGINKTKVLKLSGINVVTLEGIQTLSFIKQNGHVINVLTEYDASKEPNIHW